MSYIWIQTTHGCIHTRPPIPLLLDMSRSLLDERIYLMRETQELESNVTQRAGRPSGFLLLVFFKQTNQKPKQVLLWVVGVGGFHDNWDLGSQ